MTEPTLTRDDLAKKIARALLAIDAVKYTPHQPVTFKSGIVSPVYIDNRAVPFHPAQWHLVIDGFRQMLVDSALQCDVLAGIAVAGVPHSAALAYIMDKPSVFIRKAAKDHGLQNRVEGGPVKDQHVVLVEDLVTTGGSTLDGVGELRGAGAAVDHALAIVSYGLPVASSAFKAAGITLHTLTDFPTIMAEGSAASRFDDDAIMTISDWLADPYGWAERQDPS